MKKFSCLSIAILMLAATACDGINPDPDHVAKAEPIALTPKQIEKAACDNAFAFNLFCEVATSDDKENAFISPLSVTMALGMLYNGTSDEAGDEMAAALGVSDFTETEINEYYQKMRNALLSVDPLTAISIANSIWCEQDYPVLPDFVNVNKNYYDAEVRSLDLSASSAVDVINAWCAAKTNDMIKTIIQEIPDEVVMYLINAVYFKSKWKYQFDRKDTKDGYFIFEESYAAIGSDRVLVPMMHQKAELPYYHDDNVECLEMPYGNEAFSMLLMLPREEKTVDDIVQWLDADAYNTILAGLHEIELPISMPRFKVECKFSLKEPVADLGMKQIFGEGGLTGIADDPRLVVYDIMHKTFVEVNEEGTEAAAVTAVIAGPTSVGASFHANRPFIYLIREKSTGAILFIGRMDNPSN